MNIALEPYWNPETPAHEYLRLAERAVAAKKPMYPQIIEPLLDAAWENTEPTSQFFDLINPANWGANKLQAAQSFRPNVSVNMRINQNGNLSVTWRPFPLSVHDSDEFEPKYLHECTYRTESTIYGRSRAELMYFRNAHQLRSGFPDGHPAEKQILFALRAGYSTMLRRLQDVLHVREATAIGDVFVLKPDVHIPKRATIGTALGLLDQPARVPQLDKMQSPNTSPRRASSASGFGQIIPKERTSERKPR
jgi:hypothetical protein